MRKVCYCTIYAIISTCLLIGLIWVYTTPVKADTIRLTDAYMDYKQFLPNGFSPYMPSSSDLNKEIDLHVNTEIFRYGYWNNQVWSLWDQGQVRWFGWEYEVGVHATSFIDIFYNHFSRHEADKDNRFHSLYQEKYPVEDSIGIRFYFYRDSEHKGIF